VGGLGLGALQPDLVHGVAEFLAVLGLVDDVGARPIISTPYFVSAPEASSASAVFSAVWPPMVGSRASGRSLAMIFSTISGVIGSM
jgi:hypothetical protein